MSRTLVGHCPGQQPDTRTPRTRVYKTRPSVRTGRSVAPCHLSAREKAEADALEIEAMAKRRLADEYEAAQERGEVKSVGNPNFSRAEELPDAASVGLTAKEIHEARQIRDAEEAFTQCDQVGDDPFRVVVQRRISLCRPISAPSESNTAGNIGPDSAPFGPAVGQ